jgi:hypothetical protein
VCDPNVEKLNEMTVDEMKALAERRLAENATEEGS